MKKRRKTMLSPAGILLALTLFLNGCSFESTESIVSESLSIDVSGAEEITDADSHEGVHSDGTTYIILKFQDDKLLEQIKDNSQWHPLPMDEKSETLAYGVSDSEKSIGPYLGDIELPEIQNGYYRLIDRHEEKDTDILERASFNFTLGIYDTDTKTLYFCEIDT